MKRKSEAIEERISARCRAELWRESSAAVSSNPVVVLDEVDKLSRDYSGDPSSALLEVLDRNKTFHLQITI